MPVVSVVCVCHNQARFVTQALASVVAQDYPRVQLIVVDDASTDGSADVIGRFLADHPGVPFVHLTRRAGVCAAFNRGLALATGQYVVDLAADDLLLPTRLSRQVATFESLDARYGVLYTNAWLVDEEGQPLDFFYPANAPRHLPTGDVYRAVLGAWFICPPTVMVRRSVLDALGGYDETLTYEDFDLYVRAARGYWFYYLDEVLTGCRRVRGSHGRRSFAHRAASTLRVLEKARALSRSPTDEGALAAAVQYYLRLTYLSDALTLVPPYVALLRTLIRPDAPTRLVTWLARRGLRLGWLYRLYRVIKYGW